MLLLTVICCYPNFRARHHPNFNQIHVLLLAASVHCSSEIFFLSSAKSQSIFFNIISSQGIHLLLPNTVFFTLFFTHCLCMSLYIHCISHTFTTHTLSCLSNHTYLVCQPFTWDVYDFNLRLQVVQPRIVYLGLCVLRRDPEPSLKLGLCLLMQVRSVRVYAGRV